MAAEFSQGLMAGFQVFEGIADRRDRRRLQEERIGLARAAETRAQSAFDQQRNLISEQRDLDRSGRESNEILARAERVGFENLQPHELAELEDSAQYNPAVAGRLREHREGVQIDTDVAELARSRRGPQSLADAAQPPASFAPTPAGELTPFDVQAAVGPLDDIALPQAADGRTELVAPARLADLIPNLDISGLPIGRGRRPGELGVEVPTDMLEQLEAAKDLPVTAREQVYNEARRRMGDLSGELTITKMQRQQAQQSVDRWRGFTDMENGDGSTLRQMATNDPVQAAMMFYDDYETLKKTDPNTLATVIPQMAAPVAEAVRVTGQRVAELPRTEGGNVAMDGDTRKALADWNATLDLMSNMSDSFDEKAQATIRNGVMPIGNPNLTENLMTSLAEAPQPGKPMGTAQASATMTMARRAIQGIQDGNRDLSTRQVQAVGRLVRHGVLPPSSLASVLEGKPDAAALELMELKDGTLIRHDDMGNFEVAYQPAGARGKDDWPAEQLKFARSMYFDTLPSNAPDWQREEAQRKFNGLVSSLTDPEVREAMHLAGFSTEDMKNLSPQQLMVLGMRHDMLEPTAKNMYANQWYWGTNWVRRLINLPPSAVGFSDLLGKSMEEISQELTLASTELDQYSRSNTTQRLPTLPDIRELSDSEVAAVRMRLVADGDPDQQMMAWFGSKIALENEIRQRVAEEGPAQ
jgi:hypothetical protein